MEGNNKGKIHFDNEYLVHLQNKERKTRFVYILIFCIAVGIIFIVASKELFRLEYFISDLTNIIPLDSLYSDHAINIRYGEGHPLILVNSNGKVVDTITTIKEFEKWSDDSVEVNTNILNESPNELTLSLLDTTQVLLQQSQAGSEDKSNNEKQMSHAFLKNFPDIPPSYPGGNETIKNFLRKNLRYPSDARKKGIEGTV